MHDPKIEKNIPVPNGSRRRWDWLKRMVAGDSAFLPIGDYRDQRALQASMAMAWRTYKPMRFTSRSVTEGGAPGVRVWCVENIPTEEA